VLSSDEVEIERSIAPSSSADPARPPVLGAVAPLFQLSPLTDVLWFAPTAQNAASISAGLARAGDRWATAGQVRASGALGALGVDAAVRSSSTSPSSHDASAWLGARYRALRLERAAFELAPALRAGIPATAEGAPPRLEFAVAAGAAADRFTFVGDAGLRLWLHGEDVRADTPTVQGFLLAGATMDLASLVRLHALVDAHFIHPDQGSDKLLGGLGAGVEVGRSIFSSLSLRLSPWIAESGGPFTAQVAIGIREAH
jgi:hypothetical protein